MNDVLAGAAQAAAMMSGQEITAVVLALTYLVLAVRQNILCWLAAVISCFLYIWIMYEAGLYMESALQVFYVAMAIYGWYSWQRGSGGGRELQVSSWPLVFHVIPLLLIGLATLLSGIMLHRYTNAAMPYLDSFTTWGAIFSTWMVARKIIQNWHYWFIIDSVSIYLYASRGLWLTVLLFAIYLVLIVIGFKEWRKCLPMPSQ